MEQEWKSPRRIEEEIRNYRRKRFEDYYQAEIRGEITRQLLISALEDECEYLTSLTLEENNE